MEIISRKKPKNFKPIVRFPDDHPRWPGRPRCQGWSVTNQAQCEKTPLKGRKWCKTHGGNNAQGAASGKFKHGRYSKALSGSKTLADLYHENLERENQLSLADEIAITDSRLQELFGQSALLTVDMLKELAEIKELQLALSQSVSDLDMVGVAVNLKALGKRIDLAITRAQQKLGFDKREDQLVERRRRLSETDSRRQIQMAQTVTLAQLVATFANFGFEIRELFGRLIEDRALRQELLGGIDGIVQKYTMGGEDEPASR